MTSRRILRPDNVTHWPPPNIFPGKDITPDIDVKEAVRIWVELPEMLFAGQRTQPVLHISPPDATGYSLQWYWEGLPVVLGADGSFYIPGLADSYLKGLQAEITNPDGTRILSAPKPVSVRLLYISNQDGFPVFLTYKDANYQLKPIIPGLNNVWPVPGLVAEYIPRDPSLVAIDKNGRVNFLQDVTADIIIDVYVTYMNTRWFGSWTLKQAKYIALSSLSISPPTFNGLRVDGRVTLSIVMVPSNATVRPDQIEWMINDPEYLTMVSPPIPDPLISRRIITAVKESATPRTISAFFEGRQGIFSLPNILPRLIPVTGLRIVNKEIPPRGFRVGDKVTLYTETFPENASNAGKFNWYTSDASSVRFITSAVSQPQVTIEFLKAGSGAVITASYPMIKDTFDTGQVTPKPLPPANIDMKTETLDPRITYTGGEVPFVNTQNMIEWSAAGAYPLQYRDGLVLGRTLPEPANVNRVTKPGFEGASLTNQAGTDSWRYTTGASIAWGATDGFDGGRAFGVALWFNSSRIIQDDVIIQPLRSSYDATTNMVNKLSNGNLWSRMILNFNVSSPAVTETRADMVASNVSDGSNYMTYSYKEFEPGDYTMSIYRTLNTAGDRRVYSLPQINKGKGAAGPIKGAASTEAFFMVESNEDVQTLRLTLMNPNTNNTTTRDIATGGAVSVKVQADPNDHWWGLILTGIQYIIP